ncbi:hypothetical protein AAG570_006608 [Ranatra chinensis]|uniref:Zinc transporter ZIP1 n=1 Tax=Ranatra chinensis TaxID=642074 RepID=A0ABD0YUU3_9HEMI
MVAKVAALFILGVCALICCVLPIALTRFFGSRKDREGLGRRTDYCLDVFLRFGGGILLATTFVHMLPEVRERIEALNLEDAWPVKIPELVMCIGFFIMYGIEEMAHLFLEGHSHDHAQHHDLPTPPQQECSTEEASDKFKGHTHLVSGPPIRGLLIMIALSIHQVFEGLAVGLESSADKVWILMGAVAAHKLVIAICVGAEFAKTALCTAVMCVAVFSVAAPIGIAVGLGLTDGSVEDQTTLDTVSAILQGLATGTLLFVVFFEVVTKDTEPKKGIVHCIATIIGFLVMLVLLIFFDS